MQFKKSDALLYGVTDRTWLGQKNLGEQVEEAILGGVTCIQLREKELDNQAYIALAKEVKKVTDRYGVPFLIDDNIEVALEADADGVHLGQQDMNIETARRLLGPDKLIGMSAKTVEQALEAQKNGAAYLGVGAVFATSTKLDAKGIPHERLRDICAAVDIPVVAIGGINRMNVLQLKETGIDGIAVVSALFAQEDIQAAAQELCGLVKEIL